jgi:hypothetical protein
VYDSAFYEPSPPRKTISIDQASQEHICIKAYASEPDVMTSADDVDKVKPEDITLTEGAPGYHILVRGEHVGAIEGHPGYFEYIEIEMHWEGKGVARSALRRLMDLSRAHGESTLVTNNAVHPAMEHILETEGFEEDLDDVGWVKEL